MNRILGRFARRVDAPWKMYPVGFLFGLGFDTATEVALLVLAGTAVVGGLPFYAILSLPILFAAGMCLLDTADGCFMNFAYDWAFSRPVRKVYYNLTITGLSVFVGCRRRDRATRLLVQDSHLSGPGWSWLAGFNINTAGFVIVGVFVVTWAVALSVRHFGRIEQKWDSAAAGAIARPTAAISRTGRSLAGHHPRRPAPRSEELAPLVSNPPATHVAESGALGSERSGRPSRCTIVSAS